MTRLVALALLSVAACAELDPPTLIKRDRVLGAKVTVDGDPERAWPSPGEQATVTWLTASPGAQATFSWTLFACPAATSVGMPACAGAPIASSQSAGAVPPLQLAVPADITASSIVVAGAICASGTPAFDAATASAACSDGSRVDVVSQHVFLAIDGDNRNPDLRRAPITFTEESWNGGDDCEISVEPGGKRAVIGVAFEDADRERFVTAQGVDTREELQLAAFATAGEILQQHTYVDPADERALAQIAFEWDPPVDGAGSPIDFFLVVRDMRGGVDMTTRRLCVR